MHAFEPALYRVPGQVVGAVGHRRVGSRRETSRRSAMRTSASCPPTPPVADSYWSRLLRRHMTGSRARSDLPPQAAPDAAGAAQERQHPPLERQLQVLGPVVHHLAVHDRVRHVRRVLERVAVVEHQVRDLARLDAAVLLVDAEQLRRVERDRPQRPVVAEAVRRRHRRLVPQDPRLRHVALERRCRSPPGRPVAASTAALPSERVAASPCSRPAAASSGGRPPAPSRFASSSASR